MREPVQRYSDKDDHTPFLKALAEVRRIGVHEGWCIGTSGPMITPPSLLNGECA